MSIWRNSRKWIGHPDHFVDYPGCNCYIDKFNLEIWNKWRVEFYKDDPIKIPKEWYEAEDYIFAKNEKELIDILRKNNWDPKWYWFYYNPDCSDTSKIDAPFDCMERKRKKVKKI